MKLNRLESLLVNNPARLLHQRWVEASLLARLLPAEAGGSTLVAGCGRGVEIELALDRLRATRVDAYDLDPRQLERSRRRLGSRRADRISLWVGDATHPAVRSESYDLVIDWGVFHHVIDWRRAIAEVSRALKPGGRFLFFEVPRHKIRSARYRLLFDHPLENRFEAREFQLACEEECLTLEERMRSYFGFFYGVAVKRRSVGRLTTRARDTGRGSTG